jgi:nicotinamide mononucleotide transporter
MAEPGFMTLLGDLAGALQQTDFILWGSPVTRAEWLGAALGFWMVVCNARVHPLGWPLAMLSSLLYALVFLESHLYGQAALQVVFVVMAAWGLWEWLRPSKGTEHGLQPRMASTEVRRHAIWATLLLWGLLGTLLARTTDNPAPYADALPTAGSLVATWMLARKYSDNWLMWFLVNLSALVLFAQQGLWPTVALYAVFALMSAWGWWMWGRRGRPLASTAV